MCFVVVYCLVPYSPPHKISMHDLCVFVSLCVGACVSVFVFVHLCR